MTKLSNIAGSLVLVLIVVASTSETFAASGGTGGGAKSGGGSGFKFKIPVQFGLAGGKNTPTVTSPETGYKMDSGNFYIFSADIPIPFVHVAVDFEYASNEGSADYDFTSTQTNVRLQVTDTKTSIISTVGSAGLRFVPFESFALHPYLGGGYSYGNELINFTSNSSAVQALGYEATEIKTITGPYGEGGLEAVFKHVLGLRLSARYTQFKSASYKLLGNKEVSFNSLAIFGGVIVTL